MRKEQVLAVMVQVVPIMLLAGCSDVGRGMEGNIYDKMTVFSLLTLVVFAVILVPFVGNSSESKALSRYREVIRNAAANPLSAEDLVTNPVYVWDSPKSFHKMVFAGDGALFESEIVTGNGLDPAPKRAGSWALTPEGALQLSHTFAAGPKLLTRVSRNGYHLATLMRLNSGLAEAWFLGENSLAEVQISCYGYSQSLPSQEKFSASLVRGLTVYWATYPCTSLTSSDEVSVNPLLAYGLITFHADGTLSKSINNAIGGAADYTPAFSGSWRVDEKFGVLYLSVGLYASEITLLSQSEEHHSLLVGTVAGSEQWFLDPERAKGDLTSYLALGVYLDAEARVLYE